ncbi:MAG: twin-arginine translocation signal domain-containing protein [Bacteroidia bacterium]|nr:twin-arginine translocation signal domain-containing protein [Bacteroidia bacterium]
MKKSLNVKSDLEHINIQNEANAPNTSSRRDFLKLSAATAIGIGVANPFAAAAQVSQTSDKTKPELIQGKDPYALAARFNKYLRVTDVTDGLDAVGCADRSC